MAVTKQLKIQIDSNIPKVVKDFQDLNTTLTSTGSASQKFGAGFTIEAKHFQQALLDLQARLKGTGIQLDSLKSKETFNGKGVQEAHVSFQLLGADLVKVRHLLDQLNTAYAGEKGFKAGSNIFQINPATLQQLQQDLLTSSRMRLEALDRQLHLEAVKTKYGEDSKQAIRQKALNEIARLEQEQADKLNKIQQRASTGSISDTNALLRSQKVVQSYNELIAKQKEAVHSTEELKTAHINLFKFIGLSTLYWNVWHQSLYRTIDLLKAIPKIGMELETSKSVLTATMGGKAGAEVALRGLHDEAKRTGIAIDALRESWRTFSASTTIAGESVNTSWRIFTNMNTVITALHYSGDKASHIFMALAQMFNKSKVQSEELVKQLGNLLPGAFAAFAEASGKTTQQLVKEMKKGMVFAHDTIEKFTEFYAKRFEGAFNTASHSLNANLGRMNTAFTELGETIYSKVVYTLSDATVGLTKFVGQINTSLKTETYLIDRLKEIGVALGSLIVTPYLIKSWTYLFGALTTTTAMAAVTTKGIDTLAVRLGTLATTLASFARFAVPSVVIGLSVYWLYNKVKEDSFSDFFEKFKRDHAEFTEAVNKNQPKPLEVKIAEDAKIVQLTGDAIEARRQVEILEQALADFQKLRQAGARSKNDIFEVEGAKYTEQTGIAALAKVKQAEKTLWKDLKKKREELRAKDFDESKQAASEANQHYLDMQERVAREHLKNSKNLEEQKLGLIQEYNEKTHAVDIAALEERRKTLTEQYNKLSGITKDKEEAIAKLRQELREGKPGVTETLITSHVKDLENFKKESDALRGNKVKWDAAHKQQLEDVAEFNKDYALLSEDRLRVVEQGLKKQEQEVDKSLAYAKQALTDSLAGLEAFYSPKEEALKQKLEEINKDSTLNELDRQTKREAAQREAIKLIEERIAATQRLVNVEKQQVNTVIAGGENYVEAKFQANAGANYDKWNALFQKAEATYGVSANFLKSIAYAESKFKKDEVSPAGAKGLMQIMPFNFASLGVKDPFNVEQSIMGGAKLLAQHLDKYSGDFRLAAAAYNSGVGNVSGGKRLKGGGHTPFHEPSIPNIPETQGYVKTVMEAFAATGKEQVATKEATKALEYQKKKLQEHQANLKLYTLERSELFKNLSKDFIKASEELDTAQGKQSKAQESLHTKYAESIKLAEDFMQRGTVEQQQKAFWFLEEIDQLEEIRKKKFELLELANKQVVSLQQYQSVLDDINRLEQAGMLGGLWGMRAKDAANNNLLRVKQGQLSDAENTVKAIPFPARTFGNQAYVDALEKVSQLKKEVKDLALTSQSTMLFAAQSIGNAFDTTFRGVLDGSIKAKDAFAQFGLSVIKTLQDIILQELKSQIISLAFKGISFLGDGLFGGIDRDGNSFKGLFNAKGNAFDTNGVIPFAKGGIVHSPTLFKFAKGTGLMGEAGAEAIMPLARTSKGDLGVRVVETSSGGNTINNIYNITVTQAKDATAQETGEAVLKQVKQYVESTVDTRLNRAMKPGGMYNRQTKFG